MATEWLRQEAAGSAPSPRRSKLRHCGSQPTTCRQSPDRIRSASDEIRYVFKRGPRLGLLRPDRPVAFAHPATPGALWRFVPARSAALPTDPSRLDDGSRETPRPHSARSRTRNSSIRQNRRRRSERRAGRSDHRPPRTLCAAATGCRTADTDACSRSSSSSHAPPSCQQSLRLESDTGPGPKVPTRRGGPAGGAAGALTHAADRSRRGDTRPPSLSSFGEHWP
jgi:hypothetical protein